MGCHLAGKIASAPQTLPTCPESVRQTHVCTSDKGTIYRNWACDAAYHWDCRNSGAARRCSASHYSKYRRGPGAANHFFNTTVAMSSRRSQSDGHMHAHERSGGSGSLWRGAMHTRVHRHTLNTTGVRRGGRKVPMPTNASAARRFGARRRLNASVVRRAMRRASIANGTALRRAMRRAGMLNI